MSKVEPNTIVPYESIDPAGATSLRPGVSFLASKRTIAEVIVQKGLRSWLKPVAAKPALANAPEANPTETAELRYVNGQAASAPEIELAFALLQSTDRRRAWEVYQRIGDVLNVQVSQSGMLSEPELMRSDTMRISALSDGEASAADIELAFAALQTANGRQAWEVYHRIGDALREPVSPDLHAGSSATLAVRLAEENVPDRTLPVPGDAKTGAAK